MKRLPNILFFALAVAIAVLAFQAGITLAGSPALLDPLPVFRFPVVEGGTISGYFDHDRSNYAITFYDGRRSSGSNYGFFFSCPEVGMYDYVGCLDAVSGEPACANNRELWYDNHKGVDIEYTTYWHTGAVCNLSKFTGITHPVYAPAAGKVQFAGYDQARPANGYHIRIKHDLNSNGNYDDDNFRSVYLHFATNGLAVWTGQIISEGQYLGAGGSTGYSSSPHLHFEVQRSVDNFQTNYSVDPYGWQGSGSDPWPYPNQVLWRLPVVNLPPVGYLPLIIQNTTGCQNCADIVGDGGFEDGPNQKEWTVQGVDVISGTGDPDHRVAPHSGAWMAWMGGRNNGSDVIYQYMLVPTGASAATFKYYLFMGTDEASGVYDKMTVTLYSQNNELIKNLDYVDNSFSPALKWVERKVDIPNLSAWQGKIVRIVFQATTDSNAPTSFYVDDVSFLPR